MLLTPARKYRKRNVPVDDAPVVAGPVALTLVSASYDKDALTLTMAFDRAIDISGFSGADVIVDDGTFNNAEYLAIGSASLVDAVTVRVGLSHTSAPSGPGVFLSAAGDTGIVAVDDGATWDGVTNVGLPFP